MPFGRRNHPTTPDGFTADDWVALTSLPVQVGLWMARLDPGGAPDAEPRERAAIHDFLTMAAAKFENVPLIHHICRAALSPRYMELPLLRDVALMEKIRQIQVQMHDAMTRIEMNAYKLLLIEMAEHVARAAPDRDLGAYNLARGPEKGWYGLYPFILDNTVRRGRGPQVSLLEKSGINRLIDALDAAEIVQKWELGTRGDGPGVRIYGRGGNF